MPEQRLEQIWNDIRDELRRGSPDFRFHIWLEPLELVGIAGHRLYVCAPEHIRTSVGERYLPLLRRAAASCFDRRATVEIVGEDWSPGRGGDGMATANGEPATSDGPSDRLNPKYTFEQFVIGVGNRFAHAAALAAAELPSQAYNPLFVHGPPGLGKTHLLHAIGNYVRRYGAGLDVRYVTVEEFTSEFVDALREKRTGAFKERFRSADVVLVDDVQFLATRERTREEFFHTFNSLVEAGRQLVLTSDCSPEELVGLEPRLAQRFCSGLVVELEPPALEVRRAILEKRASHDGIQVSDDVLSEIAARVSTSVRALEGALIRVIAYASIRGEEPTPELVAHVLRRLRGEAADPACSISEIVDAAAAQFGVEPKALLARDRRPEVARARQVAMFLARELTTHSLPEIGRGIGGRNHSTVLHAVNRVGTGLRTDPATREAVDKLRDHLRARA